MAVRILTKTSFNIKLKKPRLVKKIYPLRAFVKHSAVIFVKTQCRSFLLKHRAYFGAFATDLYN